MAHRGGAVHPDLVGLENTLRAMRHAVGLGYTYLETDVHLTRDGVLLAFHDPLIDRVTDGAGAIADHTWAELAGVRIAGTEPIPRMDELLDALPHARFNIDLKAPGTAEPMAALINRRGEHARFCVGSFVGSEIRRFRALTGDRVATAASRAGVIAHRWFSLGGLSLRLVRDGASVFQVPLAHRGLRIVDRAFIDRAHALGKHVHVWTIDDPAEMARLIDLGVDGIMTDRTDLLKQVLTERQGWRETRESDD
jgi:glycerophosphoryl diester phosphodiesterase